LKNAPIARPEERGRQERTSVRDLARVTRTQLEDILQRSFKTVAEHLTSQTLNNPDNVAIIDGGKRLTFREFNHRVSGVARQLEKRGVGRGSRVLLMVKPGINMLIDVFALFRIAAIPIILDSGMSLRSFLTCVERSRPDFVRVGWKGYLLSLFFKCKRLFFIRKQEGEMADVAVDPDDLAAILFTSGSTGIPKGVCYRYRHFEAQLQKIRQHYGVEPGEIDLPLLPVFALFDPALGMTTVIPDMDFRRPSSLDPRKIVAAIQENAVTHTFGSPTLWRKIADFCEAKEVQLPTLRRILMAGCSVPFDLLEQMQGIAPNAKIHTPYGATECLPIVSIDARSLANTAALTRQGRGTCVGRPLPGIDLRIIRIADTELTHIEALPTGEIGEIAVSGDVVTDAYDGLPESTTLAKIVVDGICWHRMGDLGYLDNAGRLWFCGRKAERVVTPYKTFFTDCCEAIFNQHADVARSALIGLGHFGAQVPAIVIEPKEDVEVNYPYMQKRFLEKIRCVGKAHSLTRDIELFFICKHFPVDIRHNAKINRTELKKLYEH